MDSIQPALGSPAIPRPESPLLQTAKDLETGFLAEMLKYTGVGKTSESFGGGVGEDQFTSFLTHEQARLMTEAGGIGLAEMFFEAMQERAG